MIAPAKIVAIATTAAGTAAAVAWMVVNTGTAGSRSQPDPEPKAGDSPIVCVGSDGILRAPDGAECPSGVREFVLEEGEPRLLECGDCDDPWRKKPPPTPDASDPLAHLKQRVDNLHKSALLTVVDRGVPIFTVRPGSASTHTGSGTVVAEMRATDAGGFFAGRSTDGTLAAFVGVSDEQAGVRIMEGDVPRAEVGKHEAGNYSLRISSSDGGLVAGIGESRAGTGALLVADQQSRVRASMTFLDGVGGFTAYNAGGAALVSLRESQAAAGLFSLGETGGREAVKMTVNDDRYGVALAGPQLGFPLVTGSGLPGSYIIGCSGGGSCRPY
jgi:hypothetical protein